MNNRTFEIKPAINGYIVEDQKYFTMDNGMTDYKVDKYIFKSWTDVVKFVKDNEVVVSDIKSQ